MPFRSAVAVLLALLLTAPLLEAQLGEKPETWTSLEGHYIADTDPAESMFLMLLSRNLLNEATAARKRKNEADPLTQLAFQALGVSNVNAASRLLARLAAVYRGLTPGEWLEVASSLNFLLDRRLVSPGVTAHARIVPAFLLDRPLKGEYSARFTLLDAARTPVKGIAKLRVEELAPREISVPTGGLAEGDYLVRYELLDKDSKTLAATERELSIRSGLHEQATALRKQAEKLALAGTAQKSARHAAALHSVELVADLYDRAWDEPIASFFSRLSPLAFTLAAPRKPYHSTDPLASPDELPSAAALAAELLAGGDPLATRKGELRLAYRAASDQSLQPFRVSVPENYDAARKWPLLVVLHAEGGDDGSPFSRYLDANGESVLKRLASERGYLLVAPNGRGQYSFYSAAGGDDVFDVIALMKSMYSIDEKQVFLAGHSMGAIGTISLSLDARASFAGFAAIAGVPFQPLEYSKAPDVPFLYIHDGKETLFPPDEARRHGFILERRYKRFEYMELAADDHWSVGVSAWKPVFDFIDAVRAGKWKPSGKPIPIPAERN